jgi:adenylate cyclase class IV
VPRNIETKVRIEPPDTLDAVRARAEALADGPLEVIAQDDTFFRAPQGRLKLRRFADGRAELIHYERPDTVGARASDYVRVPLADAVAADALHAALARACGEHGRVRKTRWLLLRGATRIHLDRVDGLGDFVELEVVLRDGQGDAEGERIARDLMAALGLAERPPIAGAYLDLIEAGRGRHAAT